MKKTAALISCAIFALATVAYANPVPRIIFDTDMLTDFDDVGALACHHALAEKVSKFEVARVIDELMTRKPKHGRTH